MSIETLKQALRTQHLRRRIYVVLALLLLFRFLAYVPVPVPDNAALAVFLQRIFTSNQLLGVANLFSGGALTNFSIVMMGLGPYINASIIVQLMTQVIPKLERLSKEGEAGRRKITQYTRLLALPLALLQSVGMVLLVQRTSIAITGADLIGRPNALQWALLIGTITAGSMLLMWIGEIITEKGIGNGISLLIFAGIVAALPSTLGQIFSLAQGDATKVLTLVVFALASLAVIAFAVMLNEGTRNIPVSYARRAQGSRVFSGVDTHLPLRVITAGVIPIIFALAFLTIPQLLSQAFSGAKTQWLASAATTLGRVFSETGPVYAISYFVLVVAFTYFYTSIAFNPKDIAESLQRQGGFIPGIRPGNQTSEYLSKVVNRITLAGAVGLGTIAILPFIAQAFTRSAVLTLGGTSLLIIVSVALETLKALEAQTVNASYDRY